MYRFLSSLPEIISLLLAVALLLLRVEQRKTRSQLASLAEPVRPEGDVAFERAGRVPRGN